MRVLSLFDGMSCGQIALKKAEINVSSYFSSEVDAHAIKVSKENFPETIHLGDVRDIKFSDSLKKVDLVMGGSPCQGFSFSGKMLQFDDPRSVLFFEFVRAIKELNPKFFLLENVAMKKESEDVITNLLGVKPIIINSSLVSAQTRKRLYWTNIPVTQPEDKKIYLKDILEKDPKDPVYLSKGTQERFERYGVKLLDGSEGKARCLSAMEYLKNGKQGNYLKCFDFPVQVNASRDAGGKQPHIQDRIYHPNGKSPAITAAFGDRLKTFDLPYRIRKLTVLECKRLQTVPDDYKMNVSNSQAYKMLGNGWTVDIIAHILKGIKHEAM